MAAGYLCSNPSHILRNVSSQNDTLKAKDPKQLGVKIQFFSPGQMEAHGCVQRLDLAEIFIMSVLKLKNDVKMANLSTQARSTCLPWPSLPVYPGLVYLCTQAWPTCLPRPGLPVYPGLVNLFTQAWNFFKIWGHPRKHSFYTDFVIYGVPRPLDYHHQIRFEKLV